MDSDIVKVAKALGAFFFVFALAGLFAAAGTNQPPTPAPSPVAQQAERIYSVGEKLAVIETGSRAVSPQLVRQFETVLTGLSSKFATSEGRIADMTVKAQEIMQRRGIKESLMSILTAADASTPETLGIKYEEILAAYLTLRCGSRE